MPIKISDLILPREKLEKEYRLVNVARWQKEGEALGWSYECVLSKLRYEKINVKVASEHPVLTKKELEADSERFVSFENLIVSPWGRANGQFVNYGLSANADSAKLINQKTNNNANNQVNKPAS
ncbi:hypothetical protein J9537_05250 [Enterococcus raffinosus]|uniref:hypothetical protein n=1 Tax=Enterococcus raffinosus TaxID=71452 RepID=UPI001C46CAEE|nr:hypothetical protein [Enterococcus raffinosus]QXJ60184.1 hypothetical protein J9537_05250 [Enterococcus raffinosus]